MKYFLLPFLFTLSALAEDWSKVYQSSKESIPLLMMSSGLCSGSLIAPDLVITAHHCVSRVRPLYILWPSEMNVYEVAKIVRMDRKQDLALLRLETANSAKPFRVLTGNSEIKVGEPVSTIGHPSRPQDSWMADTIFNKDDIHLISSGIVSGLTSDSLITDTSFSPGNSGGPILNQSGQLAGVVSKKRIEGFVGNIGYAASPQAVHNFLEEHKKEGDQNIGPLSAGWDLDLWLGYTQASYSRSALGLPASDPSKKEWESFHQFDFEFRVMAWDRLFYGIGTGFSGTLNDYRNLLGYKFQFELSQGRIWNLYAALGETSRSLMPFDKVERKRKFKDLSLGFTSPYYIGLISLALELGGDSPDVSLRFQLPIF